MRRTGRTAFSLSVLASIAAAASCREPTQLTLRITTDERCSDLSGVEVVVGPSIGVTQDRFTQRFAAAVTKNCGPDTAGNLIGTLVLTPGTHDGTVIVSAGVSVNGATAPDPADCSDEVNEPRCIIARRSFSFIDHTSLTLPIDLSRLCVGKPCDSSDTCFRGACVSSNVTCTSAACDLGAVGVGSATDGGSSDGAYDADFFDATMTSSDASDGGNAADFDAGDDASSGIPACGQMDGGFYCFAVSGGAPGMSPTGTTTPGSCGNASDASMNCCHCQCPINGMAVTCDVNLPSNGSCHPVLCQ